MKPKRCQILITFFFFSLRNPGTILRCLFVSLYVICTLWIQCFFFSYLINAIQLSIAFDGCNSARRIFDLFFSHNCSLGNSHFFQVGHFQEKLLKVELWVSWQAPPKSYDWSARKKGSIRDHLAKKLSIAFTLALFGLLLTSAESKGGFSDNQERGRRHAALSSGIVRAQVPVFANHFNQLNATDTACCYEPLLRLKEAHRCVMA